MSARRLEGPAPRAALAPLALAVAGAVALAGCGPVASPPPAEPPAPVALDAAGLAAASPGRGEQLSLACQACHALDPGSESPIGPNLAGVFGRRAGTLPGFAYSPALADATFVWTVEALDDWLEDPTGFLPGTTMAFTGYRAAADRRDLIAFLLSATGASSPAVPAGDSGGGAGPGSGGQ